MTAAPTSNRPNATESARLPHRHDGLVIADGGLETWLLFVREVDLPMFASFPLLDRADGRAALRDYFDGFADVARRAGAAFVIDTPTWRANLDWAPSLGYDRDSLVEVNERSVAFARDVATAHADLHSFVNGVIGPRGDGYVVGATMSASEAMHYHALQARAFADAGADLVTAVTMTYTSEAIGIVRACAGAGIPVAIGFTTETDGRLPSGEELGAAIDAVDDATDGAAEYFMVNCAHPSHFAEALASGADWLPRVQAIRANASRMSHAELDEAEELDRGDIAELVADYSRLRDALPALRIVGGCCGTDHEHVEAIAAGLS